MQPPTLSHSEFHISNRMGFQACLLKCSCLKLVRCWAAGVLSTGDCPSAAAPAPTSSASAAATALRKNSGVVLRCLRAARSQCECSTVLLLHSWAGAAAQEGVQDTRDL